MISPVELGFEWSQSNSLGWNFKNWHYQKTILKRPMGLIAIRSKRYRWCIPVEYLRLLLTDWLPIGQCPTLGSQADISTTWTLISMDSCLVRKSQTLLCLCYLRGLDWTALFSIDFKDSLQSHSRFVLIATIAMQTFHRILFLDSLFLIKLYDVESSVEPTDDPTGATAALHWRFCRRQLVTGLIRNHT